MNHLDHSWEVTSIGQLKHNDELIVFNEWSKVPNHIRVIKMFQQVYLLDAVLPCFCIHHLKDLPATVQTVYSQLRLSNSQQNMN